MLPVLLYGCETFTLTRDLERRIEAFGNKFLRRIMGYRWFDRVTNWRFLRETGWSPIACTIRQRQLRLYGHVARFPEVDPAYRLSSCLRKRQPGVEEAKGTSTELVAWES